MCQLYSKMNQPYIHIYPLPFGLFIMNSFGSGIRHLLRITNTQNPNLEHRETKYFKKVSLYF